MRWNQVYEGHPHLIKVKLRFPLMRTDPMHIRSSWILHRINTPLEEGCCHHKVKISNHIMMFQWSSERHQSHRFQTHLSMECYPKPTLKHKPTSMYQWYIWGLPIHNWHKTNVDFEYAYPTAHKSVTNINQQSKFDRPIANQWRQTMNSFEFESEAKWCKLYSPLLCVDR